MPINSFDDYPMTWKPCILKCGTIPLHIEIAEKLEHDIRGGIIRPSTKLPPQRELADYLDVNLSTITKAFKLCAAKGLISGEVGRGTYVSADVSVSNSLSPGFRIAFVYASAQYIEQMLIGNSNINVMAPPLEAEIVSTLILCGDADKIIEEKKSELRERNRIVDQYFRRYHIYGNDVSYL